MVRGSVRRPFTHFEKPSEPGDWGLGIKHYGITYLLCVIITARAFLSNWNVTAQFLTESPPRVEVE